MRQQGRSACRKLRLDLLKMQKNKDEGKKQILLRLSSTLWKELASWAEDDFRSINAHIEFLLSECVKKRKMKKTENDF